MDAATPALLLPMGLDAFAFAAALGLTRPPARERVRISLLFALFEGGMPALGLLAGRALGGPLGAAADWLAIAVLLAFGAFTLLARDEDDEEEAARRLGAARGLAALSIGLAISVDELAAGFSIGLLGLPVVPVLAYLAVQAVVLSQLGLALGARVGERAREGSERLAGLVLVAAALALAVAELT